MSEEKYNKEIIRNRMLKFAAAFWGVKKAENFDPVVKLLIESLSNELYKLNEEFSDIETRLLEKTARMLTPGILISPTPAHAVVHTSPIEVEYLLKKDTGFYYENHSASKSKKGSLSFYPTCQTVVRNGNVKYILCDDLLYAVQHDLSKTMISRLGKKSGEPHCVWFGLELDPQITNLKNISFYLNFPNITDSYEYLYLLSCTEWSLNGKPVTVERGIYEVTDSCQNAAMSFFSNYEIANVIDMTTTGLYKNNYLTIVQDVLVCENEKKLIPEHLSAVLPEKVTQMIDTPLLWFKVQFPSNFKSNILEDIQLGINIIPVENKKLYEKNVDVDDLFGLIPLTTDENEHLLSVYSVTNAKGQPFHELLYNTQQEERYGTYSIRRGGCERFDSRSAKDLLCYLTDLLSDETSAFGSLPSTKLRSLTQQMEILITQMKQAADNIQEYREMPYYVMVDQLKGKERITVRYWVTNCESANELRSGSELVPNVGTYLKPKELFFVSSTYGGRQEPKFDERIELYRYELTTRDRILTNDDIANFCKKELGELLQSVEIRNGVAISNMPQEGLIRTKDIYLVPAGELKKPSQGELIKKDLKTKLMDKSPDTFNYRLFIKNKI